MLGPVIDKMSHTFPEDSFMRKSLSGNIFDFAGESLIPHIRDEIHESGFLVCPASPKRFERWKLVRFPTRIVRSTLPPLTPDPLGEQGVDKGPSQASVWKGNVLKELFLFHIGRRVEYFCS